MSAQTITASPSSMTIAYSSSATAYHNATVSWTHPGTELYTLEGMTLTFNADPGGYYVYILDETNIGRGSYTGKVASGEQVSIPIPEGAWANKTDGILTFRFRRPASTLAIYTDISLVLTYSANASPSTIVVADAVAGEPQTVNITNTVSTVYHTVTWTYGSITSGEQTYGAATRSPAWAVPASSLSALYQANPNSNTVTGTISVQTFTADGALVGTTTASGNLTIPQNSDTLPTVSVVLTKTHDAIGNASGEDYLQNHTTLHVTPTASAKLGASVTGISILTPDGSFAASNGSATDILLHVSGAYTITTTVTDSRSFTATDTQTITVTACPIPVIAGLDVSRCTDDGTESDEGAYVSISAAASLTISSWAYSITYTGTTTVVTSGSLIDGVGIVGGSLDKDVGYTVTVTATDALGQTASASADIGTALYTIHRMAGGKGVAFGQIAQKYGVEVTAEWPFYTHGNEIMELLVDAAHPVGSVIQTLDDDFDPNALWPWTHWGRLQDVFLLASGTHGILASGGAESVTVTVSVPSQNITLTAEQLPRSSLLGYSDADTPKYSGSRTTTTKKHGNTSGINYIDFTGDDQEAITIPAQTASGSVPVMPPYLAVNVWVRAR